MKSMCYDCEEIVNRFWTFMEDLNGMQKKQ